eukprot:TRINITY_DN9518_c0_g1_i1.p1 TRINITY_DN9518_c0_g1~~TRINITY_DN9518_c0_g1_i1.p1  ORF type:complete len:264 (+),score=48.42 TRINITY_DN9518_c0_g1_i1:84-875(+)
MVSIKITCGEEIRRLSVDDHISFIGFVTHLRTVFPHLPQDFPIRWRDSEEDMITVSSDVELAEALNSEKPVRFFIATKSKPNPTYQTRATETIHQATDALDKIYRELTERFEVCGNKLEEMLKRQQTTNTHAVDVHHSNHLQEAVIHLKEKGAFENQFAQRILGEIRRDRTTQDILKQLGIDINALLPEPQEAPQPEVVPSVPSQPESTPAPAPTPSEPIVKRSPEEVLLMEMGFTNEPLNKDLLQRFRNDVSAVIAVLTSQT